MADYFLITEPARGTSLRIDVPRGVHPDEALQAWAKTNDADTLAAWKAACDDGDHDSFASYLADASGDDVQLVEEHDQRRAFVAELDTAHDLDALTNEYSKFLIEHGLPSASADELLHMLQTVAVPYLTDFIKRWEAAEAKG